MRGKFGETILVASSRDDKQALLEKYFGGLFSDTTSFEDLPSWIYAVWDEIELAKFRRIDGYLLREALNEMSKGKSWNEEEMVVAEMLFLLSEDVFDLIAMIFKDQAMLFFGGVAKVTKAARLPRPQLKIRPGCL